MGINQEQEGGGRHLKDEIDKPISLEESFFFHTFKQRKGFPLIFNHIPLNHPPSTCNNTYNSQEFLAEH